MSSRRSLRMKYFCCFILCYSSAFMIGLAIVATASHSEKAPYGHKTLFRYRCFEETRPSWVSPIDGVGGIDHASGSADIHENIRGNGFDRFISADFDGSSEYIRSTYPVDTVDTANHDSFTIQAWFYPRRVSGYRCLVSNTQSYRGFSLKVKDGQLRGLVRFQDGSGYVNQEIIGGTINVDQWHYGAFRVKEYSDYYNLTLFIDGDQAASLDTPSHYDGVRQSSERPMVGAEPSSGAGVDSWFDGYIYAVSITNYAVGVENYLENDMIRDGSRYFGMVSYHDYLDTSDGPDHKISHTINAYGDVATYVTSRRLCPFLNDRYVPQGVAADGQDQIYLSMYWMHEDGSTGDYPSILIEHTTSGSLRRVMQLHDENDAPFSGHVGGVAYWNGYIYLPRGDDVLRYDLSQAGNYIFNPETFENPRGDMNPIYADNAYNNCNISPNTGISYLSASADYNGEPVLWTGQFDASANKSIVGFIIDGDGNINESSPSYIFTLPVTKVQGIYCYRASSEYLWFYIACSYGDNPSKIYDVLFSKNSETAASSTDIFTGPAGLEDLGMINNKVWCVSESGGKYYQKRSVNPWEDLFPFVFVFEQDPGGPTWTPTVLTTPTRTPTLSPTWIPTLSPTQTSTSTHTQTSTRTPTGTSTLTPTSSYTSTPTPTPTTAQQNTYTPTIQASPPTIPILSASGSLFIPDPKRAILS